MTEFTLNPEDIAAALAKHVEGFKPNVEQERVGRVLEVAEVRSAVPLDVAQQERLATALSRATGKQIEVKVIVDENVLGGIVARIGDTVIDGTIRRRLAQLKERI